MKQRGKHETTPRYDGREKRLLQAADGDEQQVEAVKRLLRPADVRAQRQSRRTGG